MFRSKIGLFFFFFFYTMLFLCFVGLLLLITDLLKHFITGQKLPIHEYKRVCRKTNELFFNGIKQVIAIISILMLGSISCEDSVFYRKGSVCELISVCSQQWLVILLFLCLSFSLAHTHTHARMHTHAHTHTHTHPPQLPFRCRCLLAPFDVRRVQPTVSTSTLVDTEVIFKLLCF